MLLNSKTCQWTLAVLTLAGRPSAATQHTDFEQEQTESAEAVTTLCSLGYLLFKKCARCARNLIVCSAVCPVFAADEAEPLARAQAKFRETRYDEAAQLATAVIQQDTESTAAYRLRAAAYEQLGKLDLAIADLSQVIKLQPDAADTSQHRGELHFQAGHIALSIEDFDRYLQARPDQEPYHWQRGISYYYAGEYAKGVRQFEIHKTVNPQDVENAVWHYLCGARLEGVEQARAKLIDIDRDDRPWALPVYRLFQGRLTPAEVLKPAEQGIRTETRRKDYLFYAHFYVGLYHEAAGANELARKHIEIAATQYDSPHYMGAVARVHLQRLKAMR
jgi:lipoprotein NlpI